MPMRQGCADGPVWATELGSSTGRPWPRWDLAARPPSRCRALWLSASTTKLLEDARNRARLGRRVDHAGGTAGGQDGDLDRRGSRHLARPGHHPVGQVPPRHGHAEQPPASVGDRPIRTRRCWSPPMQPCARPPARGAPPESLAPRTIVGAGSPTTAGMVDEADGSRHAYGGVIVFGWITAPSIIGSLGASSRPPPVAEHAMAKRRRATQGIARRYGPPPRSRSRVQGHRAGLRLQNALPDARILYVSATGAPPARRLCAFASRLWGGAIQAARRPSSNAPTCVTAMEAGGVAAMEVVARDLKALGPGPPKSLRPRPTWRALDLGLATAASPSV